MPTAMMTVCLRHVTSYRRSHELSVIYFPHTRKEDDNLEKCIITEMAEGTRGKGRPREPGVTTSKNGHICQQKRCCSLEILDVSFIMAPMFAPANKAPTTIISINLNMNMHIHVTGHKGRKALH